MDGPPQLKQFGCFPMRLAVRTLGTRRLHDITDDICGFVSESGVRSGFIVVQSLHTTAGLVLNEVESGLQADFDEVAGRLVPSNHSYRHDDMSVRWENICPEDADFPNGHAHLQHTIFGTPSLVLPISVGGVVLGTWQRVLLVEFDRARDRVVFMQAVGAVAASRPEEIRRWGGGTSVPTGLHQSPGARVPGLRR